MSNDNGKTFLPKRKQLNKVCQANLLGTPYYICNLFAALYMQPLCGFIYETSLQLAKTFSLSRLCLSKTENRH